MNADTSPAQSPETSYVDDAFYRTLAANFRDWQDEDAEVEDVALRDACARLLFREARLLEREQYADWLSLFASECIYWVPAVPGGGDPVRDVAIAFDDRRRLGDRIFRIGNDYAWSQVPRSRTARSVSNVAAFATDDVDIIMVRSNFQIAEFQAGDHRSYAGWSVHRLHRTGSDWEIMVKQTNLIDCDQNLRNPSIIL
jgi:benzoate/toluate 1,2-dioxygenase beta subunit